jgi:hypothetical protein
MEHILFRDNLLPFLLILPTAGFAMWLIICLIDKSGEMIRKASRKNNRAVQKLKFLNNFLIKTAVL